MPVNYLTLSHTQGGETITKTITLDVEGEHDFDVTVPGSTTDKEVAAVIDVSELAFIYITSDQTVTMETNNAGSPVQSFTITADKPFVWYTGCGWTNPLTTDVTKLFFTRGSAGDATVKIRYGVDATP